MSERIKELQKWLDENVITPPDPKKILINKIQFNWEQFNGSFCLTLDSIEMDQRFGFRVEIDGKYRVSPPFFHSPLGVPATYAQIELSDESNSRIEKLINDFFPKMKPLGLDKSSGMMIYGNTPMQDRVINMGEVIAKMKQTSAVDFQISN